MKRLISRLLAREQVIDVLRQADGARDARDWPTAAALYSEFLKDYPRRSDIWVQLGHSRKESGDVTGAKHAYEHAMSLAPKSADIHLQLGHAQKLLGDHVSAARSYTQALRLDETSASARKELSGAGLADGFLSLADKARAAADWPTAAQLYGTYLQLQPADAGVWIQLGHARKELGDLILAQQAYEGALRLKPDAIDAGLPLAHLLKKVGDTDGAVRQFARILEIDPTSSDAFQELTGFGWRELAISTVYENLPPARVARTWQNVSPGSLAIFTIASNNYMAHVRVFMESARNIYPEAHLFLCLTDREVDGALSTPRNARSY